jgi:hypothetical protein
MKIKYLFLALVSLMLFSSCEMMKEDVDDTYCGLFVCFKYDYNLQRADMFKDHVGGVTLYVFDSDGRFVRTYEDNNVPQMGTLLYDGSYQYCMKIDDLPKGDYRFVALASQKAYEGTLSTSGAKYRRSSLSQGDASESLTVTLDREKSVTAPYDVTNGISVCPVDNAAPLDTLWHGMTGTEPIVVEPYGYNTTTISMTRDTKMLTIGLHNLDIERTNISADEFEVFIIDNNGKLAYNNELLADDYLLYKPFHSWDTQSLDGYGTVTDRTAHYSLTFNRLIWHDLAEKNAVLFIYNKATGKQVAAINLTDFLAQGRNAYDQYAYSRQEYLDRSYDYYMDFFIKNDVWQYADVRINILSWAQRIQNVNLK